MFLIANVTYFVVFIMKQWLKDNILILVSVAASFSFLLFLSCKFDKEGKIYEKVKNLFGYCLIIVIILLVLTLLIVGFQTLFGDGAGCMYDLSC